MQYWELSILFFGDYAMKKLFAAFVIIICISTHAASQKIVTQFEQGGYTEMNGVVYSGNFYAKGEIEYTTFNSYGETVKKITAVYITGYKLCAANIRHRVPWTETDRVELEEVDLMHRIDKKNPCFTVTIHGIQTWLQFPGYYARP